MSYRNPNTSQGSDDFQNLKDSLNSEADFSGELGEEKKVRKENKFEKKFLFKKESKDKGYSSLAGDTNQDSVFLVNTKNSKKPKADTKITSLSVFKKSFKDDKRLKDIKENKEEVKRNKKLKERSNWLQSYKNIIKSKVSIKISDYFQICMEENTKKTYLVTTLKMPSGSFLQTTVSKCQPPSEYAWTWLNRMASTVNTSTDAVSTNPNWRASVMSSTPARLRQNSTSWRLIRIWPVQLSRSSCGNWRLRWSVMSLWLFLKSAIQASPTRTRWQRSRSWRSRFLLGCHSPIWTRSHIWQIISIAFCTRFGSNPIKLFLPQKYISIIFIEWFK